jgi:hypothetical protein
MTEITEIDKQGGFNIESALRVLAYTSPFFIGIGLIKQVIYYRAFKVNILDFLELSESIVALFNEIVLLMLAVAIWAFLNFLINLWLKSRLKLIDEDHMTAKNKLAMASEAIKTYNDISSLKERWQVVKEKNKAQHGIISKDEESLLDKDIIELENSRENIINSLTEEFPIIEQITKSVNNRLKRLYYAGLFLLIAIVIIYAIEVVELYKTPLIAPNLSYYTLIIGIGLPFIIMLVAWLRKKLLSNSVKIYETYLQISLLAITFAGIVIYSALISVEITKRTYPYIGSTIYLERDSIVTDSTIQYLGKAQKYLFFYNRKEEISTIVPTEGIKKIDLIHRKPKKRAQVVQRRIRK